VAHLLTRAQLRIGDVEEPRAAGQRAQLVPCGDVRGIVVGVPRREAVGEWNRAVSGDGQDQHELLEIGSVILGMPARRDHGRLAGALLTVRSDVVAVQHDGGGIVVQLAAVDPELADRSQHQLAQQRGAIGVEQLVKRAADAVVVEQLCLPGPETEQPRLERGGPAGQAVERLARHAQIADQYADRGRSRERRAPVSGRQVTLKRACEIDPRKELVDHGQRTQPGRCQLKRASSARLLRWLIRFRHELPVKY